MTLLTTAGAILMFIALIHSVLGEKGLIGPVLRDLPPLEIPRWAAARILRFAWHLTSVTWVICGILLMGASAGDPVALWLGIMMLACGAIIVWRLPGHLAWPFFATGGGLALLGYMGGPAALSETARTALALGAAGVFAVLGAIHIYWAAGGTRGLDGVFPKIDGKPFKMPPVWMTLAVAFGLFAMGLIVAAPLLGADALLPTDLRNTLLLVIAGIFTLRAIGDFRFAGIFKSKHEGRFAELDSKLYVPICVGLAWTTALLAA